MTKEEYELTDEGAAVSEKTASLLDLKVGDATDSQKRRQEISGKNCCDHRELCRTLCLYDTEGI